MGQSFVEFRPVRTTFEKNKKILAKYSYLQCIRMGSHKNNDDHSASGEKKAFYRIICQVMSSDGQ